MGDIPCRVSNPPIGVVRFIHNKVGYLEDQNPMKVYRGCMMAVFGVIIGVFSLLFSQTFGLLGLLLPPALVTVAYAFVGAIIEELAYLLGGDDS